MLVLACSLGIAFFIYPLLSIFLVRKKPLYIALFPLLVGTIYLIMALGFAMETRGIGEAEELQHRPFIWAYFVFTVWAIAGAYWILENVLQSSKWLNGVAIAIGFGLLAVPWHFSADVQNLEKGGGLIHIPRCQYEAARYIGQVSDPQDLIQASNSSVALSAFAGRQNWIALFNRRLPKNYESQMQLFNQTVNQSDKDTIEQFMHTQKIRYFVSEPGVTPDWNALFQNRIAFECEGYRVFDFNSYRN